MVSQASPRRRSSLVEVEPGRFGCRNESWVETSDSDTWDQFKRRRITYDVDPKAYFPVLKSLDYYVHPSLDDMLIGESIHAGYCSRIPDFVIGRSGYGEIRFNGETDVRWLDIENIVKFSRHSVSVYDNEDEKPPVGHGLNKPAEVTILLKPRAVNTLSINLEALVNKLRRCTEKQGAHFISFDLSTRKWKFLVNHFSRFGLDEDEEDDFKDDATISDKDEGAEEYPEEIVEMPLPHSLPTHLGLDPKKMQDMRSILFPDEENEGLDTDARFLSHRRYAVMEHPDADSPSSSRKTPLRRSPLRGSFRKTANQSSPLHEAPQALLEYRHHIAKVSPPQNLLMAGNNKGLPLRTRKVEGFKLESKSSSFIGRCDSYSNNIVDAAMFMGRTFRVGWGPNGVLVHSGSPVRSPGAGLSSIINIEWVATNNAVTDENNKVKEELIDLGFVSPLNLHRSLDRELFEIQVGSSSLQLQKTVASRNALPNVCRKFIDVIEKWLSFSCLPTLARLIMMHQIVVWQLISVLFSEGKEYGYLNPSMGDDEGSVEDMMLDKNDATANMYNEIQRRALFSSWLRDCVHHRVHEDVSESNGFNDLQRILLLLSGRQLTDAVDLAIKRGDSRLAILLSQSGGSMVSRSDMSCQLDIWRNNDLDFNFIEKDRIKIYELLAGNVQVAFSDLSIDWKRCLGLVMWYHLQPDTPLPLIIATYQELLGEERVPHPVPIYIDGKPSDEVPNWREGNCYDFAYYLMLLYASGGKSCESLKAMFSASSSTPDPLDYHMIWHQRAILEAIGAFSSNDLHLLDMSFISQLLKLGQCQWALYVALNMSYREDFPCMHATVVREILFQYCEIWSADAEQWQFIEDLGIPSEWMHEALAIYHQYYGNLGKALEHFLKCSNWQKAHSIFMTSESHPLFLSSQKSEIYRITRYMEKHKAEIADWDLGAGIFIDFYDLENSLLDGKDLNKPGVVEKITADCRNLFNRMDRSLLVWGIKLSTIARAVYSEMVEQLCKLLASIPGVPIPVQASFFQTALEAPIPEDMQSRHLQDAVSALLCFISGTAT